MCRPPFLPKVGGTLSETKRERRKNCKKELKNEKRRKREKISIFLPEVETLKFLISCSTK